MANTAGTGKAGRDLLAAIDKVTSETDPVAVLRLNLATGCYSVKEASNRSFAKATFARLADAGLITTNFGYPPLASLTAAGRSLLGA